MIGCLRTCVRKRPIVGLYFESETVLKFYNLGTWSQGYNFNFMPNSTKHEIFPAKDAKMQTTVILIANMNYFFFSGKFIKLRSSEISIRIQIGKVKID